MEAVEARPPVELKIQLQRLARADIPVLIGWAESADFLLQWSGPIFSFPLDEAQLERHLRQSEGSAPTLLPFKVVLRATQEMVGYIELSDIDRRNRSANVSRVIVGSQELRGRGIGRQMMREILRVGFGELHLHRIALFAFDFNARAITCYESVGFQKEGRLRDARRIRDEYWSPYVMSILESEWVERDREVGFPAQLSEGG